LILSGEQIKNSLEVIMRGNQNSLSDSGVSLICSYGAALSAYYNVLINLQGIENEKTEKILSDANKLMQEIEEKFKEGKEEVEKRLNANYSK
jgi:formiminotetrahydrofolate cyclodeaminase